MKNAYDYLNNVKMDFSVYEEKERIVMKKAPTKKVIMIAAAVTVFAVSTAFATGVVDTIVKKVSTGYNSFQQIDPTAAQPLPDGMIGKIYDKDGNALESLTRADAQNMYDKNGNKITGEMFAKLYEEATGTQVKISESGDEAVSTVHYATPEEAQAEAAFDIKIPKYMPEGFILSDIYAFRGDNGAVSGYYRNLVYTNAAGKEITLHERLLNEETAFEAGTDGKLEEITINGRKAVIMNDASINFETEDNVSVGIYSKGNITRDELIKIAESIG